MSSKNVAFSWLRTVAVPWKRVCLAVCFPNAQSCPCDHLSIQRLHTCASLHLPLRLGHLPPLVHPALQDNPRLLGVASADPRGHLECPVRGCPGTVGHSLIFVTTGSCTVARVKVRCVSVRERLHALPGPRCPGTVPCRPPFRSPSFRVCPVQCPAPVAPFTPSSCVLQAAAQGPRC